MESSKQINTTSENTTDNLSKAEHDDNHENRSENTTDSNTTQTELEDKTTTEPEPPIFNDTQFKQYFEKYDYLGKGHLSEEELIRALPYKISKKTARILTEFFDESEVNGIRYESSIDCYKTMNIWWNFFVKSAGNGPWPDLSRLRNAFFELGYRN